MKLIFLKNNLIFILLMLPLIYGQTSLDLKGTSQELINDGIKAVLGIDQLIKTIKKVGIIPMPFLLPIKSATFRSLLSAAKSNSGKTSGWTKGTPQGNENSFNYFLRI